MFKKRLFVIILALTILVICIILILTHTINYNKLIINEDKWNDIISNRNMSTSICLENIKFNDYNLPIDEENSVIYYSMVDIKNKYNPSVNYITNNEKLKVAINSNITRDIFEQSDVLKVMIYNDKIYRIYSLVVTNYPILNITYKDKLKNKTDIDLELFDNHVNSPKRVLKSIGKLKVIDENKEYSFSLKKESLGHNERENYISIFGMEMSDEYTIRFADTTEDDKMYVNFFINDKYIGLYSLGFKDGRGVNNYERNKENNK